jgi:hypothetical protein
MEMIPSDIPPPPSEAEIREGNNRSWIMIGAMFAALGMVLLWSCGRGVYRNYRAAHSAVEQFHQRLDRGDYESIYEDTSASFRGAGSQEDEIKFFKNVHQKMGNSGATTATGFHINWQNGNLFVNQLFSTQFTQGQAQEEFVWLIDGDQPLLQSYRIDAAQLH